MKFFIPVKKDPRVLPPLVSLIRGLAKLGHDVELVGYYCSPEILSIAASERVTITMTSDEPYPADSTAVMRVAKTALAYQTLSKRLSAARDIDIVWRGMTDYRYLPSLLRYHRVNAATVLQMHEYAPQHFPLCERADFVVVPEENRAWLTKFGAGLKQRPIVLPNIPFEHPRLIDPTQADDTLAKLKQGGKCIVLYQGYIAMTERCVQELIAAVGYCRPDIVLALLPATSLNEKEQITINDVATRCGVRERVFILPTRVAPNHLDVVGQADIGIGLYSPTSLNQVYCAPNRIYEFTGFGIPLVLPDYPGVRQIAIQHRCVELCDPRSPESIAEAIELIANGDAIARYRQRAKQFFDSQGDYLYQLARVVDHISDAMGTK